VRASAGKTIQSRQLGRQLRELRKDARLPADGVAAELGLSPATVYRYETGDSVPRPPDTLLMCELYGVDGSQREALVDLTKQADTPGWWRSHNGTFSEWFNPYVSMEETANHIRAYDAELVFPLLQTEPHAAALARLDASAPSEDERSRRVAARMRRQRILARRRPPKLEVLLGEVALMRSPSADVMAAQLDHLDALSRRPQIAIRIVPVGALHAGLDCGARFVMLAFPPDRRGVAEPPVVYSEDLTGGAFLDKPEEIAAYERVWEAMLRAALTPGESRQLIHDYIKRYQE
jgi:transcriptional regulator with XRE-family HTH domain